MWLSLIWTKLKPEAAWPAGCPTPAVVAANSLEVGTPPAMVQRRPVPAQAMQERKLRRSIPSVDRRSDGPSDRRSLDPGVVSSSGEWAGVTLLVSCFGFIGRSSADGN